MPIPKSAVDVISPAFEHTKRQLFQPFRLGNWTRLAVIAVLTGEFLGAGWNGPSNINIPGGSSEPEQKFRLLTEKGPTPDQIVAALTKYLPWILVGVVALACLAIVWMYVESVFRFVLFDAVLRSKYGIRAGWRRWRQAGSWFVLWQFGLSTVELAIIGLIAGLPALLLWRAGTFDRPADHFGTLFGVAALAFAGVMLVAVAGGLVQSLAKDLVVPVMAMENVRVLEGWRRLWRMMRPEKSAYVIYVLMKIVLGLGSAILFGMAGAVVFIALLIPVGLAGGALIVLGKAWGLAWNEYTIGAAVVLGAIGLLAIFYVMGMVYAPGMVFFQAYALHFLGARYPVLGAELPRGPGAVAGPIESSISS